MNFEKYDNSNFSMITCERKFLALMTMEDFTLNWLNHVCRNDPKFPQGFINTLYYDTKDLALYFEKRNGDYLKSKIRLRWYDDNKNEHNGDKFEMFLEFKLRNGSGRHKFREKLIFNLEKGELPDFTDRQFLSLIDKNAANIPERLPLNIFPVINIKYERERFICPYSGARVCLDKNIRSSWINDSVLPYKKAVSSNFIVLEIKDAKMMDIPWLEELFHCGFRSMSYSKYGNLVDQIIGGN